MAAPHFSQLPPASTWAWSRATKLEKGGRCSYLSPTPNSFERVRFQLTTDDKPNTAPFGISDPYDKDKPSDKRNFELTINSPELLAFAKSVDQACINVMMANLNEWFPTNKGKGPDGKLTESDLRSLYVPLVKDDTEYEPSIRLKVIVEGNAKKDRVKIFRQLPDGSGGIYQTGLAVVSRKHPAGVDEIAVQTTYGFRIGDVVKIGNEVHTVKDMTKTSFLFNSPTANIHDKDTVIYRSRLEDVPKFSRVISIVEFGGLYMMSKQISLTATVTEFILLNEKAPQAFSFNTSFKLCAPPSESNNDGPDMRDEVDNLSVLEAEIAKRRRLNSVAPRNDDGTVDDTVDDPMDH